VNAPRRFGIAGAGAIASVYAEAFEGGEPRVVAVADSDPAAAESFARRVGARAFDSAAAMARHADIDAAIVCTPPSSHPEVAAAFSARGIPVLCEKPAAISPEEALAMFARAREGRGLLAVSSKFRHCADVASAKRLVEAGAVGDPLLVEVTFTSFVDMSGRWNSDPRVSGGGVLIDNGTHAADLLLYFLGPIAEVLAVEGVRRQGARVEDTAYLHARSAGGAEARVDLSWSIATRNPSFLRVFGTVGEIEVGWNGSRVRRAGEAPAQFGNGYDKLACFRAQVANFGRAVAGLEALALPEAEAVASVDLVSAAYAALGRGGWVRVADARPLRRVV